MDSRNSFVRSFVRSKVRSFQTKCRSFVRSFQSSFVVLVFVVSILLVPCVCIVCDEFSCSGARVRACVRLWHFFVVVGWVLVECTVSMFTF